MTRAGGGSGAATADPAAAFALGAACLLGAAGAVVLMARR